MSKAGKSHTSNRQFWRIEIETSSIVQRKEKFVVSSKIAGNLGVDFPKKI